MSHRISRFSRRPFAQYFIYIMLDKKVVYKVSLVVNLLSAFALTARSEGAKNEIKSCAGV
jgi:hypothetical protein